MIFALEVHLDKHRTDSNSAAKKTFDTVGCSVTAESTERGSFRWSVGPTGNIQCASCDNPRGRSSVTLLLTQ